MKSVSLSSRRNKPPGKIVAFPKQEKTRRTGLAGCLWKYGPAAMFALTGDIHSIHTFEQDVHEAARALPGDPLKALYDYMVMAAAAYEKAKKAGAL